MFLSREACADLGIISQGFPESTISTLPSLHAERPPTSPTPPAQLDNVDSNGPTPAPQPTCSCPRRTKPPPAPSSLPFPATPENRVKLQEYILKHYAASTLNTCEHQVLPLMDGPPLRLMIDPTATPSVHHSPIPVPLHWQDAVKADLDRDVRLGVLEQVPIGNPVTWCHQMVICAGGKWHTEAHHRFSAPQCPSNKGDSPHPVPIPPSPFRPPRQTENRVRRLEWRRPAPRRSSLHDIHHPVGPLQVQNSPPGLHIFWRWLYQKI